ncbi:MAG TPA: type III pantothenate kinase [Rudaea sp.]
MNLLIDLGNSRLKWATWNAAVLRPGSALVHLGSIDNVDFSALWKDTPVPAQVWVASVAAAALEETLARSLRDRFALEPHFVRSSAAAAGVRSAYAAPEQLGVDRFLGLVAVHAREAAPTVLVGCGTALTLDAIDAEGRHLGGLIAPSPALMHDALIGRTARIAPVEHAHVVDFADNTADAVESGTWLAASALVERFVVRTAARLRSAPNIVFTGGDGARLAALTGLPHRLEEHLVLRGLAVYADRMDGSGTAN